MHKLPSRAIIHNLYNNIIAKPDFCIDVRHRQAVGMRRERGAKTGVGAQELAVAEKQLAEEERRRDSLERLGRPRSGAERRRTGSMYRMRAAAVLAAEEQERRWEKEEGSEAADGATARPGRVKQVLCPPGSGPTVWLEQGWRHSGWWRRHKVQIE